MEPSGRHVGSVAGVTVRDGASRTAAPRREGRRRDGWTLVRHDQLLSTTASVIITGVDSAYPNISESFAGSPVGE